MFLMVSSSNQDDDVHLNRLRVVELNVDDKDDLVRKHKQRRMSVNGKGKVLTIGLLGVLLVVNVDEQRSVMIEGLGLDAWDAPEDLEASPPHYK
ncbi:hypothetical protein Tco_1325359 [Tanacetum coccineum]